MTNDIFSVDNILLHLLPAVFAAGGAWVAVRYELRNIRRVTNWAVGVLLDLVEDHNKRHPDVPISLGEIGRAFFGNGDFRV